MRKIFMTLIAAMGFVGFATTVQAACLDMAETETATTVATDTTTKPILQEQGGG
jgi:hypothetical protein